MNQELLKLVGILGGGIVAFVIGFIVMKKKKEQLSDNLMDYGKRDSEKHNYSPTLSGKEEVGKNYIMQYKATYPREALKAALIKAGNPEMDVEEWLNKYL